MTALDTDRRMIVIADLTHNHSIFSNNTAIMNEHLDILLSTDWRIHLVNQNRGRCYYRSREITLPAWMLKRAVDYRLWYISHEMSHAFAPINAMHGPEFMAWLKIICPLESQMHEIGYKPKNAILAGIGCFDF